MTTATIPAPPAATRASQTDLMRDLANAIDRQAMTPPHAIGFFDHEHAAISMRFADQANAAVVGWVMYLQSRGLTVVESFTGPPFSHRGGVHYQYTVSLDALDGWRVSLRTVVDQPAAGA